MRLHVLTGSRDLLHPEILLPEITADFVDPRARVAQAYWISPKCGDRYHHFLQDEPGDGRTAAMAEALKDGFGTRFEPLLILPDLLQEMRDNAPPVPEDRRSQLTVVREILACGHVRDVRLHGLALPSKADPDGSWAVPAGIVPGTVRECIERLRKGLVDDAGVESVATRVAEITPDWPAFNSLYNNAVSTQLVLRLEPQLVRDGWSTDREKLGVAISRILAAWNSKGIYLGLPLGQARLDAIALHVYGRLLQE